MMCPLILYHLFYLFYYLSIISLYVRYPCIRQISIYYVSLFLRPDIPLFCVSGEPQGWSWGRDWEGGGSGWGGSRMQDRAGRRVCGGCCPGQHCFQGEQGREAGAQGGLGSVGGRRGDGDQGVGGGVGVGGREGDHGTGAACVGVRGHPPVEGCPMEPRGCGPESVASNLWTHRDPSAPRLSPQTASRASVDSVCILVKSQRVG